MVAAVDFPALGTGARILVTRPDRLPAARAAVERVVEAVDAACSRFREDSELSRVHQAGGRSRPISLLLAELVSAGLRAAQITEGAVDPTVGSAMRRIGYDDDFPRVVRDTRPISLTPQPAPGWRCVDLDLAGRRLRLPAGVELDLGASAKAFAADRAAREAAAAAGCGVLVSLGGDISIAGAAPGGGWRVLVTDDHAGPDDGPGQTVFLTGGALATSSTTVRRWRRGDVQLHHIVDPATGLPARPWWRTVSVGAASCLDANVAATAAIVWGGPAADWLVRHRLPSRLVALNGAVTAVAGWPAESAAAS
ncbi:MAG TPA: FAD:protein FMN transferase [Candidatus Dormibacteraeota bacterium]|nr:FAD:protein FMN transferase [Candidatus Dormibacteraeota bacterium]